jgi:hypothetical protein
MLLAITAACATDYEGDAASDDGTGQTAEGPFCSGTGSLGWSEWGGKYAGIAPPSSGALVADCRDANSGSSARIALVGSDLYISVTKVEAQTSSCPNNKRNCPPPPASGTSTTYRWKSTISSVTKNPGGNNDVLALSTAEAALAQGTTGADACYGRASNLIQATVEFVSGSEYQRGASNYDDNARDASLSFQWGGGALSFVQSCQINNLSAVRALKP